MTGCLKVLPQFLLYGTFTDGLCVISESSLYDLKRTVRKKLGLPSDSSISLAQIRDGQIVDLDDGRLAYCAFPRLWILNIFIYD